MALNNQLVFDSNCYLVDRWLEDRPLHSALSHGTFRSTGGLTAGKQISSVTIHQGMLLSVTAVFVLVNPYTMEGVESLCILLYTSVNVRVVNGQRLKFNPTDRKQTY